MDIKIKVTNPTRRTVTVTIPAADVATSEKEVLKGFASEAAIPGFRPGKAPEAIVRQKYAKSIDEEVSQRLLSKGYEEIRKEKGFTVYTLADVKKDEVKTGKFTLDPWIGKLLCLLLDHATSPEIIALVLCLS